MTGSVAGCGDYLVGAVAPRTASRLTASAYGDNWPFDRVLVTVCRDQQVGTANEERATRARRDFHILTPPTRGLCRSSQDHARAASVLDWSLKAVLP